MKLIAIKIIALITGSVFSILIVLILALIGPVIIETFIDVINITILFLFVVAVGIAWYYNKLGGLLITGVSILQFIIDYEKIYWHPLFGWIRYALLAVGPLLLLYVFVNEINKYDH